MCQMRIYISQINDFCINIFNGKREVTRIKVAILLFLWDKMHNGLSLFYCPPLSRKHGDIKSHSSVRPSVCLSVCLSVCHKNFNLGHNFCTITDRALILGMCVPCDKTFPVVPCRDLDGDLWPSSRSNLLPSGGPQFSEFACLHKTYLIDIMSFLNWNRKR